MWRGLTWNEGWYVVIIESCKRSTIKKTHVRQPKGHFCLWLLGTLSPEPVCCMSINHKNLSMCFQDYPNILRYHFTGNVTIHIVRDWTLTLENKRQLKKSENVGALFIRTIFIRNYLTTPPWNDILETFPLTTDGTSRSCIAVLPMFNHTATCRCPKILIKRL